MEEVTVTNHLHKTCPLRVVLEVDADFADLFEVKDGVSADREVIYTHDRASLTLAYRHAGFLRSVTIAASSPATTTRVGFEHNLTLGPGEQWSTSFTITPFAAQPGARFARREPRGLLEDVRTARSAELETWLARAPALRADDPALVNTYTTSLSDLGALRIHPDKVRDDFHEQEPGKILHELRFGELTTSGRRPHSPYFGSADATPLFLVLLDEYHRWSADDSLVHDLEGNARAALAWIESSGDPDRDGYIEYECRNQTTGLANQCSKDSWDSIQFADGTLAVGPIATCEIQGYAYDAQLRAARLAREVWNDETLSEHLQERARDLRARFRRDFWIPERGCHALALDGDKRQVDSLTSNIGHLLWSGILDESEAAATAERLLEEQLYSAGAFAPWARARRATTHSTTTPGRSGRTTTH